MVPRNRAQAGFTLIEVLIAVFVLAMGFLGVATMQMVSLKNNNNAALRTRALILGQDIADRMRANPAGVAAGSYDSTPSCPSSCNPETSTCSPANLAAFDLCDWQSQVAELPGGQGQLASDAANGIYQARIMWDDQRTGATGTDCSGDPEVDLLCFDLQFRP